MLCCCAKTPSYPSQAFPSTCSRFLMEHATTFQNTQPGDSGISLRAAMWSGAALQQCCCHHVTVKPPTLRPSVICSDPDKWLFCRGSGNNRHCLSNPTCTNPIPKPSRQESQTQQSGSKGTLAADTLHLHESWRLVYCHRHGDVCVCNSNRPRKPQHREWVSRGCKPTLVLVAQGAPACLLSTEQTVARVRR